jgi:hypothetical protein
MQFLSFQADDCRTVFEVLLCCSDERMMMDDEPSDLS